MESKVTYELQGATVEVERFFTGQKPLEELLVEWMLQCQDTLWQKQF